MSQTKTNVRLVFITIFMTILTINVNYKYPIVKLRSHNIKGLILNIRHVQNVRITILLVRIRLLVKNKLMKKIFAEIKTRVDFVINVN